MNTKDHPRNLRHPITAEVGGVTCELLTTGHLANAIGRTTRTVRIWQQLNLLPKPPFVLDYYSSCRRWLYPKAFVDDLAQIADSGVIGRRMDKEKWFVFEKMVDAAEAEFITPLCGVMRPVKLTLRKTSQVG